MFTKAGEPGWKSIIPIYSTYVLFKLVWTAKDFAILCGSIVLGYVFALVGGNAVVQSGELVATDGGNPILGILAFAALIVALVWAVRLALKTAAAYGKGTGFGIGLVLFPTIFTLILGFGSAEYVGPQEERLCLGVRACTVQPPALRPPMRRGAFFVRDDKNSRMS
jgi:hypothetical protein